MPAAHRFARHPIAHACACTLFAGAAMAQTPDTPPTSTLPEVRVKAAADAPDALPPAAPGGKTATGARLGVLGNTKLVDAPFSVTAYTAETIDDRQAQTVGAVLRSDPSVRMTTNEGHVVENFNIRGFAVSSSSMAINGLYGLAPEQSTPTEMFERIELVKGPSAMLTGLPPSGDVGGVVNLVTKRAGDTPLTRFTGSFYGEGNLTAHADIGRRIGPDSRLGVRVNALMAGGETWLDRQTKARELGHLAVDYRGNGWTAELDAYSVTQKVRKGSPMQPILTGWTTMPAAPDGSTNFFYGENVYSNTHSTGAIARGTVELTRDWSAYATYGTASHDYSGFIFGTRPIYLAANAATGNATGTAYNSWGESRTETGEVGVRGQFGTGPVSHRVTVAASQMKYDGGSRANGTAAITSNLYDPVPITMPAEAAASTWRATSDDTSRALSLADTLSFAQDTVLLTLGARAQRIVQQIPGYDEQSVTPLVGLVAKPWGESVALYGNYVEGLSAGTVVPTTNASNGRPYGNAGATLDPYRTKQGELGVKWFTDNLWTSLALFQITKPALIEVANGSGTLTYQADGEQRNRGIEWAVSGRVLPSVVLQGGAAYTKAKQTKTQNGTNEGLTALGVPEWTGNLGADWSVPYVAGLVLTGQVNYTGSQWLSGDNKVKVPSWTTLDAGARYDVKLGEQHATFRALVTNLTDKAYYESVWGSGRVNVGAPRAVHLSVTFDI